MNSHRKIKKNGFNNAYDENSDLIFSVLQNEGRVQQRQLKKKSIQIGAGFLNKDCGETKEEQIQTIWLKIQRDKSDFLKNINTGSLKAEA